MRRVELVGGAVGRRVLGRFVRAEVEVQPVSHGRNSSPQAGQVTIFFSSSRDCSSAGHRIEGGAFEQGVEIRGGQTGEEGAGVGLIYP